MPSVELGASWRPHGVARRHRTERRHAHATARAGDRVDLLDEADRAAFLARRLAELLEEVADLATGRAVELVLECGRRHEQERHTRLARHRLRHVRLAGAGRPLEQHALARAAAHHLAERLVPEEEVERLDDLVLHRAEAYDVVERGLDLARVVAHVRRLAHRHHGHDDDDAEDHHQAERQEDRDLHLGEVGEAQADGIRRPYPPVEVRRDGRDPAQQSPEPPTSCGLPDPADVEGIGEDRLPGHQPQVGGTAERRRIRAAPRHPTPRGQWVQCRVLPRAELPTQGNGVAAVREARLRSTGAGVARVTRIDARSETRASALGSGGGVTAAAVLAGAGSGPSARCSPAILRPT